MTHHQYELFNCMQHTLFTSVRMLATVVHVTMKLWNCNSSIWAIFIAFSACNASTQFYLLNCHGLKWLRISNWIMVHHHHYRVWKSALINAKWCSSALLHQRVTFYVRPFATDWPRIPIEFSLRESFTRILTIWDENCYVEKNHFAAGSENIHILALMIMILLPCELRTAIVKNIAFVLFSK